MRSIPKTIWIYWAQGEAEAPHVVQRCLESWYTRNPGWELRVLDEESANALIDLSDVPEGLPRRFKADVLRLRLLKEFGGVWTDATTFCHRPFEDWLPMQAASGFFAFSDPSLSLASDPHTKDLFYDDIYVPMGGFAQPRVKGCMGACRAFALDAYFLFDVRDPWSYANGRSRKGRGAWLAYQQAVLEGGCTP